MKFLLQGLLAMVILFTISYWVATIPTTTSGKTGATPAGVLDLAFNLQASR